MFFLSLFSFDRHILYNHGLQQEMQTPSEMHEIPFVLSQELFLIYKVVISSEYKQ